MKINILVAYHTNTEIIQDGILLPIQVGRALSELKLPIIGDDTGDNISHKNPYYCEMTAVYWAWKNLTNLDYIGLCHYRRFFTFDSVTISFWSRIKRNISKYHNGVSFHYPNSIYEETNLNQRAMDFSKKVDFLLESQKIDLIVTNPAGVGNNVYKHLLHYISKTHVEIVKKIVSSHFVNYKEILDKTLNQDFLYAYNMTIMKADVFDSYCKFIFSFLQMHEDEILSTKWCISLEEGCFARVSAYIAELLTHVFICKCKEDGLIVKHLNFLINV